VQDRMRIGTADKARVMEALEAALLHGKGRVAVFVLDIPSPSAGEGARRAGEGCSEKGGQWPPFFIR